MKTRRRIGLMIALAVGLTGLAFGQTGSQVQYNIAPSSRVWFDGTSTLHSFSAKSESVIGTIVADGPLKISAASLKQDSLTQASISIPVRTLKSGDKGLDDNMYKAMKADKFADIEYKLINTEFDAPADTLKGTLPLKTTGELTIAGVKKDIQMNTSFLVRPDGTLELRGNDTILMTEFGIQPPTMMFGVIKTGDQVVVHFDLLLTPIQSNALTER